MKSKYGFDTTEARSELMSKIKGKNTKPEITIRKAMWNEGIRYRINNAKIIGKPDITIKKYKLAIFIDGEYWHGYNWKLKKTKIKTNRDYWIKKIEGNMQRDKYNDSILKENGWTVLHFWEQETKIALDKCLAKIKLVIKKHQEG